RIQRIVQRTLIRAEFKQASPPTVAELSVPSPNLIMKPPGLSDGGLLPQLGGEELVPGPGADGVPRRRQQSAVADCPGAWCPNRQHPSATRANPQVLPEQVRPVAHLWSGHVRRAAGGLAQRQFDEPARDVAGINRLDDEARWHWRHGEPAQLSRIGQA